MVWYSHPKLLTFKLTALPKRYPAGFVFPPGVTPNTADYFDRGWCFCESSVSNLVKDFDKVLDLAKFSGMHSRLSDEHLGYVIRECAASRAPPLTPAAFSEQLELKQFTSKKADLATVGGLYEATFTARMGAATQLEYGNLQWGDAEASVLAALISSGALPRCVELLLGGNEIGDAGCAALAAAVSSGAMPKCKRIFLHGNPASYEAKRAVTDAVKKLAK